MNIVFQIIAIVLMAAFYGCYFFKMFLQKQKGIKTDQLGQGKKGFIKFIEVTVKLVTIIVPVVDVVSIFAKSWLSRFGSLPIMPLWLRIAGAAICGTGVLFFILSVLHMQDNWRAGVPQADKTDLVTDGIYAISRNPAFLGFDLLYVGILLMFYNWLLFTVSLVGVIMLHLQIVNVEEDFLQYTFPTEYTVYRKTVARYFGRKKSKH
jgi:protein-S-isoprenylcysteine O-methyltransferase Ste14